MIYDCPSVQYIFEYIRVNITKQAHISPIDVIVTSNRCLKVLDNNGVPLEEDMRPVHSPCVSYFDMYRGIALDYVWLTTISILLRFLGEVKDSCRVMPQRHIVFKEIVCEIYFYIGNRGSTPLGEALAKMRANINVNLL